MSARGAEGTALRRGGGNRVARVRIRELVVARVKHADSSHAARRKEHL